MQRVDFDNALNEAGWEFINQWNAGNYGQMSGALFNNIKPILKPVIQRYLDAKAKELHLDEDWYARYRDEVEA